MSSKFICGLELHVSLSTATKIFCSCAIAPKTAEPNTFVCPICMGMPGSKPVLNKKAVDYAIKLSIALNCKISDEIVFSRKTYFYPDLAKNFQITQYEVPLGNNGFVQLSSGKKIRISRVHLEEDPGALVHDSGSMALVDYNRSGDPLCEIVTEPDITSEEEAAEFLEKLRAIISYLGIFDSSNSVVKADTNVSVPKGERVEVKNVTGTRNVEAAIKSEVVRQTELLNSGKKVERETRGFNEETGSTYSMRKKETEDDYGYIIDADLVPVKISKEWVAKMKAEMPELPEERAKRLAKTFKLKEYDATVITSDKGIADIFEECAKIDSSIALRIVSRELLGVLNYNKLSLSDTKITADGISGLVSLIKAGKVGDKNAKLSIIKYALEGIAPEKFLNSENLLIDSSSADIEGVVKQVVSENSTAFAEFKSGNSKSLNFLIGKAMRELKGKADARQIQKMLEEME